MDSYCSVEKCFKPRYVKGYCLMHYTRVRKHNDENHARKNNTTNKCTVDGCDNFIMALSLCKTHYHRKRYSGTTDLQRNGFVWLREHHGYSCFSIKKKTFYIHQIIAEEAIGKPLPSGAIVHHANEDTLDNRNCNLVICGSRAYHKLLHQRIDALNSGNPVHYRKCWMCGEYSDPSTMRRKGVKNSFIHKECSSRYSKSLKTRKLGTTDTAIP